MSATALLLDLQPTAAAPDAAERQAEGLARFRQIGLPDRKTEAWHFSYSALRSVSRTAYAAGGDAPASTAVPDGLALGIEGAATIVFVNGRFSHADALPKGVERGASPAITGGRFSDLPFAALSDGLASDGLSLTIKRGALVEQPIHVIWLSVPGAVPLAFAPRLSVIAEAGSVATLIESHVGEDGTATLSTPVSEITVADGAVLDHAVLQEEALSASHIAATAVTVGANASYRSFRLSLGAALGRADVRVELAGAGASATVDGAYAAGTGQHLDATVLVDHAAPRGVSHQSWKAVLDGSSRGVFQGRIHVREGAVGTDGNQVHKAILLSPAARVDAKPELTVLADDVACAHGAASGALDEDALFYLRARGLEPELARSLLIEGFLDDVIEGIPQEIIRDALSARVKGWLAARKSTS